MYKTHSGSNVNLAARGVHTSIDADGLRVALFSGNYNYIKEGANQALNKLVGHLLDRGAAVRVYSPTTDTPAFEPVGDLVSVPSIPFPGRSEFRVALGLPRPVRDDVRAFAPNVVHLSTPDWLGSNAQAFARQLGAAVFASLHTRFETYFQYYGLGALRSWALNRQARFYRGCDHVFAPNDANRNHLVTLGVPAPKVTIWGRGVDCDRFSPAHYDAAWRRSHGYSDDDFVILFFGRLVREKGIATFVETMCALRARGYRVQPLIVGDGPARCELEEGIGDAVFCGHLQDEALGRAVASANALLNPSLTETFGNVTLEAMASGLAAVAADVDSSRHLITDGANGILCRPNAGTFADALEGLIRNRDQASQLGKRARALAKERQWPQVLDAALGAYRAELAAC